MIAVNRFYAALDSRGVLAIEGPDTDSFLQGQTTCDLNELGPAHSITGAYCTPQGRMVTEFRIVPVAEESRLLAMHRGLCEASAATFGKYIVFSKAEVRDASNDWQQFALWGEDLATLFEAGPGEQNASWQALGAHWVQLDAAGERVQAWVPRESAGTLSEWLAGRAAPAPENAWQLAEINAGEAHLEPATAEMFIPQMLNYQLTGQVSFTKGCYTGQEVVARMHYRGKLKRPMYLASVSSTALPAAGDTLFKPGSEQSVGNVVNAAPEGDGVRMLAVVTRDAIANGIHLGAPDGPLLEFQELPYPLEEESS